MKPIAIAGLIVLVTPALSWAQSPQDGPPTAQEATRLVTLFLAEMYGCGQVHDVRYSVRPDEKGRFHIHAAAPCAGGGMEFKTLTMSVKRNPNQTRVAGGGWDLAVLVSDRDGKYSNAIAKSWIAQATSGKRAAPSAPAIYAPVARAKNPAAPAPPSASTTDLTREAAADTLNRYLSNPHVTMLEFVKGGIQRAEQDGLVQPSGVPAFPQWAFTPKGIGLVGTHVSQNTIAVPLGGGAGPRFQLSLGLAERVIQVTGVADGPYPNFKHVEYDTAYIFPSEMSALSNYVFSGARGNRANLQKYDDGWRVAR